MPIQFQVNVDDDVVIITTQGHVSDDEMMEMRIETMRTLNETGIQNFIVDMSGLKSLLKNNVVRTYEMGKEFIELNFPLSMKTAVILPRDDKVKEQAEFLHMVEINRTRPPLKYVASYAEAMAWFKA
jgi:hypothetical protein